MKDKLQFLHVCFFLVMGIGDPVFGQQSGELMEEKFGSYTPNAGFRLVTTDKGVVNFKLFTYLRYLNQLDLDSVYTNTSGTSLIDQRQDMQVNKVNIQFHGWFMDPRFRYIFYVWTNNTAQGQVAQVVVAGNLQYSFKEYLTVGGGINALPGVRSTEGNFPFWLPVDNRLYADEYFRPSYTTGIWVKGQFFEKFAYNVMLGNNLSQLGIDAGQLDRGFNTLSGALTWFPTTGEFGLNSSFGDFEDHQKVATRIGVHFTRSDEDRQGVPSSEAFENVTIRISDGSVVFNTGIFGQGIRVDNVTYNMASLDAGAKYKGFALEGEYYLRRVKNLEGIGTEALPFDQLEDNGYQILGSAMVIDKSVQIYGAYSKINGEYGDPYDFRAGINWFPWKNQVVRWNFEWINSHSSPVGGLSLPMPVGANGNIFYTNFLVNF
jgi:hypothetical protein